MTTELGIGERRLVVTCNHCGDKQTAVGPAGTVLDLLARCEQAHDLVRPTCPQTLVRADLLQWGELPGKES